MGGFEYGVQNVKSGLKYGGHRPAPTAPTVSRRTCKPRAYGPSRNGSVSPFAKRAQYESNSSISLNPSKTAWAPRCRHPRLEVTTEHRAVDMVEEGYDVVIRVDPDPDESLIGRISPRDRNVVVTSPTCGAPAGGAPMPAVVRGGAGADDVARWEL